ncbi:hypothetical protein SELMODRAFT_431733 [Selaginella moellendorffii]|uniref:Uncharacterized protein n=1 Tax=Selaginella moellendorffii TaxID=88036 RepID=D8TDL7_SELML|nr:hypothetical protein SELMODRAFT_431733 [Selaginella moellendorffii]
MEDDGLDDLFKNRRIGVATISRIRDLDLKAQDLLLLSPQFLAELCQTVGASDDERFKIFAAVSAAQQSAVTGIYGFDLLEKLESLVRKERPVIVRAPPQSGISGHSFEYMWHQHYPHVPIERLNSSEPTLILVDEGQSGFHAPDITLWAKIKSAQAGGMLHIVLVSSVASDKDDTDVPPTPIIFQPSCAVTRMLQHDCESSGLSLQFSNAECMELWQNWCKFCGFVPSNNDILYYMMMEVGDRQPGLMTHMLDWLVRGMFNDKNRADCFVIGTGNQSYAGILSKLLRSSSALGFVKKTELSSEDLSAANMLLRRGQLVRTKAHELYVPFAFALSLFCIFMCHCNINAAKASNNVH